MQNSRNLILIVVSVVAYRAINIHFAPFIILNLKFNNDGLFKFKGFWGFGVYLQFLISNLSFYFVQQ